MSIDASGGPARSLQGKVVAVTGAAYGIGAATARALRAAGATVVGIDRLACGDAVDFSISADLSGAATAQRVIGDVIEAAGRIDALVNNAGLARHAAVTDIDAGELELMWAVNVRATIVLTRDAMRAMAKPAGDGGRIVNVISTAGLVGQPGESAYCATKAAVRGFTEGAAEEGRLCGVHVTGLYPAGVTTGFWDEAVGDRAAFTGTKRWLEPQSVADQIVGVLALPPDVDVPSLVVRAPGDFDAEAVARKLALVRR